MNDENLTVIYKFEAKLDSKGEFNIPKEEIKSLYEKGFKNVEVLILGSSLSAAESSGIDINLYNNIKTRQSLPDTVVLDFLSIKGKLAGTDYKNKVRFE